MSEFKGTPGPWCVDTTVSLGAYGVWTDYVTHPGHDGAGYGSQVCSVITDCFKLTDKGKQRTQRDANARLIAASPDLLATLTRIQEMADGELRRIGAIPGSSISQIEADARAAIAKALGT